MELVVYRRKWSNFNYFFSINGEEYEVTWNYFSFANNILLNGKRIGFKKRPIFSLNKIVKFALNHQEYQFKSTKETLFEGYPKIQFLNHIFFHANDFNFQTREIKVIESTFRKRKIVKSDFQKTRNSRNYYDIFSLVFPSGINHDELVAIAVYFVVLYYETHSTGMV